MKILIYTHSFAPAVGGAEKYILLLAEGLAGLPSSDAASPMAIKVATQTPAGNLDDSQFAFEVVRRPGLFRLVRLVYEADIVHLSGACFAPLFLAWMVGKPLVIEHHGYNASCPNGLLFYEPKQSVCPEHFMAGRYSHCIKCNLQTFPRRWLCQRASVNIPITRHVLKRLALARSTVIYYGIPDPCCDARPMGLTSRTVDRRSFAYVGRLVALKGLPVLLQAAAILKEQDYRFRLKFIGDGAQRPALELLARELRLEDYVQFTGFASGKRFEAEMESVATVIMPSIWEETAGLAAIEQMMRGRLVIVSDIGGLGEVVGDAGLKCRPADAASLADCMKRVLDQPEIVDKFGSIARARAVSLFRLNQMLNAHLQVYQDLAKSNGKLARDADTL
jgi:glycosyltransferase involved in cell wall biosynthesis